MYFYKKNLKNTYILGAFLTTLFVIFSAGKEVYVGYIVQKINPFFLNFICFSLTSIFFSLVSFFYNKKSLLTIKQNLYGIIGLNISTMLFWISSFLALTYIEPSIQHSINTAIGPIITIIWLYSFKKKTSLHELITAILMLLVICFMTIISALGKSSIGCSGLKDVSIGIFFCIISGSSIVGNTIFSKKLSNSAMPAALVLSTRFYLLILVSFAVFLFNKISYGGYDLRHTFYEILLLTFFGITFPLFILQKGIEKSDPMTISFVIALGPIFTYIFQIFDSRLFISHYSLIGIFLMICLILYNIKIRYKSL